MRAGRNAVRETEPTWFRRQASSTLFPTHHAGRDCLRCDGRHILAGFRLEQDHFRLSRPCAQLPQVSHKRSMQGLAGGAAQR